MCWPSKHILVLEEAQWAEGQSRGSAVQCVGVWLQLWWQESVCSVACGKKIVHSTRILWCEVTQVGLEQWDTASPSLVASSFAWVPPSFLLQVALLHVDAVLQCVSVLLVPEHTVPLQHGICSLLLASSSVTTSCWFVFQFWHRGSQDASFWKQAPTHQALPFWMLNWWRQSWLG